MPCWEVRTMNVEFQAKHRKLLEQAVEVLGWTFETLLEGLKVRVSSWDVFTIDLNASTATIRAEQQPLLNRLKQAYSKECLKRAAKLRGWQFKQQQGQMKGVLRK